MLGDVKLQCLVDTKLQIIEINDQLNMQPMYHYRDTKTIPIKIALASLLSTATQGGKFYFSAI